MLLRITCWSSSPASSLSCSSDLEPPPALLLFSEKRPNYLSVCEDLSARNRRIVYSRLKVQVPESLPDDPSRWTTDYPQRTGSSLTRAPIPAQLVTNDNSGLENREGSRVPENRPLQNRHQQNCHGQTQTEFGSHAIGSRTAPFGLNRLLHGPVNFDNLARLIRHCGKTKALSDGRRVHAYLRRYGYDLRPFLGNCLIQMYGDNGRVEDARAVFEQLVKPSTLSWRILMKVYIQNGNLEHATALFARIPQRDVVSWNALIAACAQNGKGREALDFFYQMHLESIEPDKITFICVLDACTTLTALEEGQKIHAVIVTREEERDIIVENALINMYGKCSSLHDARTVFTRMPQRNVISWTAMILACGQNGHGKEALDLFGQMHLDGVKPNKITFLCALDACSSLTALKEGQEVHARIIDSGYEGDIVVGTALTSMFGKCGSVNNARSVFGRLPQRDTVSCSAMMTAYIQNGCSKEALKLFHQMKAEGLAPDRVTFICALDACDNLAALELGQEIHAAIVDCGYEASIVVGTAIVNMYGKCGSPHTARSVFDQMPRRDIVIWSSMIAAYAQNGHGTEALNLFSQMQFEGVKPDKIAFICVLDACAGLAALEEGQEIHTAIVARKFDQDVVVGNALVNMYGKCGSLDGAKSAFARIYQLDVVSWNSMIAAFGQNGHGKEALDVFHQMQLDGVKPNTVTFVCILTACSHAGQVGDAGHFFTSMSRDYGITPTVEHYECMIDLLARAGHLEEAEDLINLMPLERRPSAWSSLLGACRNHGDMERGLRAANHYFELEPKNASPFVMLSNICAATSSWDDAVDEGEVVRKEADWVQLC